MSRRCPVSVSPKLLGWLLLGLLLAFGARPARAQQRPATSGRPAVAAPPSTLRCRFLRLAPGRDTTTFSLSDTLTIVPGSVSAEGRAVSYDPGPGRYQIIRPAPRDSAGFAIPDSVRLCYRVLPLQLAAPRFRRPRQLMDSLEFRDRRLGFEDFSQQEQILSTPGISKTGNLARGISFGNTQNVFVNSALNLQLEGQLTDNIQLTAAISDQNVPFQPEGNTQQLQQFDRIYITLTAPQWSLTAGDVVLRNKPDYFLRYYKNIQGAAIEANLGPPGLGLLGGVGNGAFTAPAAGAVVGNPGNIGSSNGPGSVPGSGPALGGSAPGGGVGIPNPGLINGLNNGASNGVGNGQNAGLSDGQSAAVTTAGRDGRGREIRSSTTVAGGVAKGKFASLDIAPIENVQGPYRLRGPNGEQFIIVLANSERVYLDGRLQVRGFDYDYVIDYNLAEVTFSPRHLITRNSRLRVEFEYSDLNYARSLVALSHYQQVGKLRLHGNFYQEADNPDNAPNLNLNPEDRERLRQAGNVAVALTPGADSVAYDRTQVLYRRDPATGRFRRAVGADTLGGVYQVRFTEVTQGQGDYRLSSTELNANGRVFEYAGAGQGRYAPVRLLPTPLRKQQVTAGASYELDSTATVFVDLARSRLERNRFSPAADQGAAMRLGYAVRGRSLAGLPILENYLRDYRLYSTLDYEYTAAGFTPIDRYRDVEFDRNWSAQNTVAGTSTGQTPREDNIFNFSLGLLRDPNNAISYRVSRRYRAGEVRGLQHWLDVAQKLGDVELRGSLFVLGADAGSRRSAWARGEATARFVRGAVVPGYAYRFDKNRVALPDGRELTSANYFDEHNVFVMSRDSARLNYRLDYSRRQDQAPNEERTAIARRAQAQTWQGSLATRIGKTQDLRVLATYRDLRAASADSARRRTVLGKIDYNAGLLQGQVRSELSYSIGTGRELKRDFSFVAVPAGQGTHFYAGDLNSDGIQQKEEFFEAQTPDAQYRTFIKVFLPTQDYITAFTNRLSYRLTANAPRPWREAGGWRAAAARFSSISSVTLDRRTTDPGLGARLNPFGSPTNGEQTLGANRLLRNTLYYNRSNPIFGAEFTVQQTKLKTLLAQGFDLRNILSQSLLVRRTLAQSFTGRLLVARNVREAASTYLSQRNFRLLLYDVQPEISYQPTPALRLTGTYLRQSKRNSLPNLTQPNEQLAQGTFDELGLETRLSQVNKRTITANVRGTRVGFQGDPATVAGIEILNALRPGSNFTWNLNLEQRLSNGLNINVAYDGRKASGLRTVHTGRMQVAVLF
ncbi:hypothetical protein [uncultured Hymenobacter sp.]|uniref:hypothetical protein n=1 Tax=uncultured Hymenobacter sp. TaxID=170016 RepID=UPI0035CA7428